MTWMLFSQANGSTTFLFRNCKDGDWSVKNMEDAKLDDLKQV